MSIQCYGVLFLKGISTQFYVHMALCVYYKYFFIKVCTILQFDYKCVVINIIKLKCILKSPMYA